MRSTTFLSLALVLAAVPAPAQSGPARPADAERAAAPAGWKPGVLALDDVQVFAVPEFDRAALIAEDFDRRSEGLPPRYAVPVAVRITPFTHGTLEALGPESLLWRLRIRAPGAQSLNLGFTRYVMPADGRLMVYSADGDHVVRPFTAADNESHGELWTPIVPGEELVVELFLPALELDRLELELTSIGYGYRGFGLRDAGAEDSGSCNVDVNCPIADPWRSEIPAVGVISTGGSTFCTGFMVNNTAGDQTPYFMTANHCGINTGNAASLVVYWNYETSVCGGPPDGSLSQFNTGSTYMASYAPSDFTLVVLDDDPDPSFGVAFAGWNRSGVEESGAVAIHHPNTDEKRISFEYQPTTTTSYLGSTVPGDGTHVRITDWDVGTTEGGSSGSPLFNPGHQVIGQLHGGYAACGNDLSDWYGRFSVSWDGGGTPTTRLADWLDPLGTAPLGISTLAQPSLPPGGTTVHVGPVGGPFTKRLTRYTITNGSEDAIAYKVSLTYGDVFLLNGGVAPVRGMLAAGASVEVRVAIGSAASCLQAGRVTEEVLFEDLTNGSSSVRTHHIDVGRTITHQFTMDVDPGWTTEGQWAFGVPAGSGGAAHGGPDPSSGATGSNVLGYNLAGDYPDNLAESHLTSTAIDCSALSGVRVLFSRWLNVEQPAYDHAYFRVSNDGTNWTTVWQNGAEVTDASWSEQAFDISAIADGQPTVYLRWTMGSTDGSWRFSGWNVDDVRISAIGPNTGTVKPHCMFQ